MVKQYRKRKIQTLVLDPIGDGDWFADYQTDDPEAFLDTYWESRNCAAFIDESGEVIGRYDKALVRTATRGRHWGHNNHYITQRAATLNRTVRDQCSSLFLFASSVPDCDLHSKEWNNPGLIEGAQLEQGGYFYVTRFGKLQRGNIFTDKTGDLTR